MTRGRTVSSRASTSVDRDYQVGYSKPPKNTRFKSGQSGNPRGRPKGARNRPPAHRRLMHIALEEGYREITVRDGDRPVKLPSMQAIIRRLVLEAVKGDKRSQKMVLDLVGSFEHQKKTEHDQALQAAIEYKSNMEKEIAFRERAGLPTDDILPRPEDIHINFAESTFEIQGPMDEDQKELWDSVQIKDKRCKKAIADLEKEMAKHPEDREILQELQRVRAYHRRIREILEACKNWRRTITD